MILLNIADNDVCTDAFTIQCDSYYHILVTLAYKLIIMQLHAYALTYLCTCIVTVCSSLTVKIIL